MGKRNPLEEEFYNSMLYKNLGSAGGKVAQGIGKAVEEVGRSIGEAVQGVGRSMGGNDDGYPPPPVNPPPYYGSPTRGGPPPSYNPPPQSPPYNSPPQPPPYNSPPQPPPYQSGEYRYTPPRQAAPRPRPAPPPRAKPSAAAGVPKTPKPAKKSGNARYILPFVVGSAVLLLLSTRSAMTFAAVVAVSAVAAGLVMLIMALRSRKKRAPAVAATPPQVSPKAAPKATPKEKASDTGNPELDKVIDDGNAYIAKLRAANVAIEDEGVSCSIDRMEKSCKGIFQYVLDKPSKVPQIKKFLNYYLPTTLKLLGSYERLSRQTVKGENISATMFDIEGMMQTIASAFEKQLDSLFGDEAMDIQADITVFESILQQEGLKDEPKVKTK